MKHGIIPVLRMVIIIAVIMGSIAFFGYQVYRNMGTGSKASGSGAVTVTMSSSLSGPAAVNSVFTIGITLSANSGNTISAVDLYFNDPQEAFDFAADKIATMPLEDPATKAFDEPVQIKTESRSPIDTSQRLVRLTMVAKRPTSQLKSSTTIRLPFRARATAHAVYPSVVTFGLNTGTSVITGPAINGNTFSLQPANPSVQVSLACNGTATCPSGESCYQSACRLPCGTGGTCSGVYHCESNVCVPGAGGGSSSSSSVHNEPTVTPYPPASPDKANLYFKVSMPDMDSGVGTVPQVRVQVRDGGNPITEIVTTLYRQPGTDYFRTNSPLELDIPAGNAKQYNILVKQLKTVRHLFTARLQRGTTSDCIAADASCGGGTLGSPGAPGKALLSGDSDGFNDGSLGTQSSVSYNKIDTTDLQRMKEGYGVSPLPAEPNADFNLDGKIDIQDLGILGKNYGKTGE